MADTPEAWYHPASNKMYQCLRCGHSTPFFLSMRAHLRRHARTVSCGICGKEFSTILETRQHLGLAHPSRQPLDFEQVLVSAGPAELIVEVTTTNESGDASTRRLHGAFQCPRCLFTTWWEAAIVEHAQADGHLEGLRCDLCGDPLAEHLLADDPTEHAPLDCFRIDDEDLEELVCGVRARIEP